MKKMKTVKSKAFTLAEILITLSIIGVVAALTIPALIQRTGNEEAVSRLMKAYSTLSQATEAIMTERGAAPNWAVSQDAIYNAYKERLRTAKDCGSNAGCFTRKITNGTIGVTNLNGSETFWTLENGSEIRALILSDGTSINFSYNNSNAGCKIGFNNDIGLKNYCGSITVDVNGAKKPNQRGRDIFIFGIKKDGLYPAGVDDPSPNYSCDKNGNAYGRQGSGCAARVIAEGDMNY